MSKRNVAFVKPEPSFLKRLKCEIGYKEGPTVDTKRESLPNDNDQNNERVEEEPQIVVLKPGDLNAEEVELEKKRLEAEENTKPADLNERIIFRPTTKQTCSIQDNACSPKLKDNFYKKVVPKSNEKSKNKPLSFDVDEEEEIE